MAGIWATSEVQGSENICGMKRREMMPGTSHLVRQVNLRSLSPGSWRHTIIWKSVLVASFLFSQGFWFSLVLQTAAILGSMNASRPVFFLLQKDVFLCMCVCLSVWVQVPAKRSHEVVGSPGSNWSYRCVSHPMRPLATELGSSGWRAAGSPKHQGISPAPRLGFLLSIFNWIFGKNMLLSSEKETTGLERTAGL